MFYLRTFRLIIKGDEYIKQYREICERILETGEQKGDRTGVGTLSVFGHQSRYDLQEGFPLLTLKKTNFSLIASELLWFIKGDSNIRYLLEHGNTIWTDWAFKNYIQSEEYKGKLEIANLNSQEKAVQKLVQDEMREFEHTIVTNREFGDKWGELGRVYGKQWRDWKNGLNESIDQLKNAIEMLKTNPNSRRNIVMAWNPAEVDDMALPPCHAFFQFYVREGKYLDCQLYQRSADVFLGVPFNIASYALLVHFIAREVGLEAGHFVHTLGDTHIYLNHLEQVELMLSREEYQLCTIKIDTDTSIWNLEPNDIKLVDYVSHKAIRGAVAV